MKRRDFLLVRDVLRQADYLTYGQRHQLAWDFAGAIAEQSSTDRNFNQTQFVHEVELTGPDRDNATPITRPAIMERGDDVDTESSASSQHFIDTGKYLLFSDQTQE